MATNGHLKGGGTRNKTIWYSVRVGLRERGRECGVRGRINSFVVTLISRRADALRFAEATLAVRATDKWRICQWHGRRGTRGKVGERGCVRGLAENCLGS